MKDNREWVFTPSRQLWSTIGEYYFWKPVSREIRSYRPLRRCAISHPHSMPSRRIWIPSLEDSPSRLTCFWSFAWLQAQLITACWSRAWAACTWVHVSSATSKKASSAQPWLLLHRSCKYQPSRSAASAGFTSQRGWKSCHQPLRLDNKMLGPSLKRVAPLIRLC